MLLWARRGCLDPLATALRALSLSMVLTITTLPSLLSVGMMP